jgi:hypothetical protein
MLHLPPLRFFCVGGVWDRTKDCIIFEKRKLNKPTTEVIHIEEQTRGQESHASLLFLDLV